MTRTRSMSNVCFALVLCCSCGGTGAGADEPLRPDSVLTYNVYLGANIADTLRADTMAELVERVERAWAQFQATDFPARAAVIADRIEEENPSLVGLQEVVAVYLQPVGDRLMGGETPANDLVIDFQQVLLAELAGRGLDYRVAVRVETSDVEVPSASGKDIRVIDHDVILVRGDLTVDETEANRYVARLPMGALADADARPQVDDRARSRICRRRRDAPGHADAVREHTPRGQLRRGGAAGAGRRAAGVAGAAQRAGDPRR
jgi:hypothetical protein